MRDARLDLGSSVAPAPDGTRRSRPRALSPGVGAGPSPCGVPQPARRWTVHADDLPDGSEFLHREQPVGRWYVRIDLAGDRREAVRATGSLTPGREGGRPCP